jgi:hypothetical protein
MFCETITMLETVWCHAPNCVLVWSKVHQGGTEVLELLGL